MKDNALILYGAPPSLYTAKVRSCLRKNSIAFEERFQSHPDYRARVLPQANNHRIPVVEFAGGKVVQDSALILDELEHRFPEIPKPTGAMRVLELFVETYADRSLLKAAMHYRWNFAPENLKFILGEFGRILKFSEPENWDAAGNTIASRMSAYLPPLGITAGTIPAIEAAYTKLLEALNAHFTVYPYLLGQSPSRADYGLMGPFAGHLGRDPHPLRLLQQTAPMVFRWMERMNAPEWTSPEFPEQRSGYFDPENIPATLTRVLAQIGTEFMSELLATNVAFKAWFLANPDAPSGSMISPKGQDQPSFGAITYPLEGATIQQASAGHTLWLHQRTLDAYAAMQQDGQIAATKLFEAFGAGHALSMLLPRRLSRLQNRLSLA